MLEQFFTGKVVIDHDLSPLKQTFSMHGNETGVSGTGTNQIHLSGIRHFYYLFHNQNSQISKDKRAFPKYGKAL
jgi:hypothetical protein